MATEAPVQEKRKLTFRTVLLLGLALILVIFAVKNLEPAPIWPIGHKPMIVVILISFVLGALIGWLFRSITSPRMKVTRGG